jgi:hypothetical protein
MDGRVKILDFGLAKSAGRRDDAPADGGAELDGVAEEVASAIAAPY